MKRFFLYLFGFSLLSMSFMCAEGPGNYSEQDSAAVMEEPVSESAYDYDESQTESSEPVPEQRKLIKTGDLELEVKNIKETEQKIRAIVKDHSGYISYENETNNDYQHAVDIKVRIPADQFDNFTNSLLNTFEKFERKNINVADVTEEFLDIEARLKTKKALEERYLGLLSRAKNVTEVIEVEKELANIRGDIERMEGRMKYLKNQTSFSTVSIRFYKQTPTSPVISENRYGRAFQNGWRIIVEFSLLLVTLWPLLLLGAIVIGFFVVRGKRKKLKSQ